MVANQSNLDALLAIIGNITKRLAITHKVIAEANRASHQLTAKLFDCGDQLDQIMPTLVQQTGQLKRLTQTQSETNKALTAAVTLTGIVRATAVAPTRPGQLDTGVNTLALDTLSPALMRLRATVNVVIGVFTELQDRGKSSIVRLLQWIPTLFASLETGITQTIHRAKAFFSKSLNGDTRWLTNRTQHHSSQVKTGRINRLVVAPVRKRLLFTPEFAKPNGSALASIVRYGSRELNDTANLNRQLADETPNSLKQTRQTVAAALTPAIEILNAVINASVEAFINWAVAQPKVARAIGSVITVMDSLNRALTAVLQLLDTMEKALSLLRRAVNAVSSRFAHGRRTLLRFRRALRNVSKVALRLRSSFKSVTRAVSSMASSLGRGIAAIGKFGRRTFTALRSLKGVGSLASRLFSPLRSLGAIAKRAITPFMSLGKSISRALRGAGTKAWSLLTKGISSAALATQRYLSIRKGAAKAAKTAKTPKKARLGGVERRLRQPVKTASPKLTKRSGKAFSKALQTAKKVPQAVVKGPAKVAKSLLGKAGKMALRVGRFIPGIGTILTAADLAYTVYDNWSAIKNTASNVVDSIGNFFAASDKKEQAKNRAKLQPLMTPQRQREQAILRQRGYLAKPAETSLVATALKTLSAQLVGLISGDKETLVKLKSSALNGFNQLNEILGIDVPLTSLAGVNSKAAWAAPATTIARINTQAAAQPPQMAGIMPQTSKQATQDNRVSISEGAIVINATNAASAEEIAQAVQAQLEKIENEREADKRSTMTDLY